MSEERPSQEHEHDDTTAPDIGRICVAPSQHFRSHIVLTPYQISAAIQ